MVLQYLEHILADGVLLSCSIAMLLLFLIDISLVIGRSFGIVRFRQISFATTVVSVGLFATFLGVLIGLYGFDSRDIATSVPQLLEGLRFAFAGSALGMFLSLVLSVVHKLVGGEGEGDEVLERIDAKMELLVATVKSPGQLVKQFTEMKGFLKEHLEKINLSLDQALQQLARGATQEVTQALEKIIREFNENLTAQFGDNFKELNTACRQMVEWQHKYRDHVDRAEGKLKQILTALDQAAEGAQQIVSSNKASQETCREIAQLIKTYDVQIRTLETHLASCRALGDEAKAFLENSHQALTSTAQNVQRFSEVIEGSVGTQSQALAELTRGLEQQVPKSLGELEKVLTNLTTQFASDYRSLFQFITDKR